MKPEVNILKDLMYALMREQQHTSFGSDEFKKRAKQINLLADLIEKLDRRSLLTKIFTCKKEPSETR